MTPPGTPLPQQQVEQKEDVRHNAPYPYPPSPAGSPHRADSARKQRSLQSVPSVASAHHASLSVVGEGASRQQNPSNVANLHSQVPLLQPLSLRWLHVSWLIHPCQGVNFVLPQLREYGAQCRRTLSRIPASSPDCWERDRELLCVFLLTDATSPRSQPWG